MKTISTMQYKYADTQIKVLLPWLFVLGVVLLCLMFPEQAHASTSGSGLPWETPLDTFKQSITGPVALIISVIGIVGCGAGLIWGGEINDFMRKMIMVIFAISIIVAASSLLTKLFQASGAVIPLTQSTIASKPSTPSFLSPDALTSWDYLTMHGVRP